MGRRMSAAVGLVVVLMGVPLVLLEFTGAPGLGALPDLEGIKRAIELRWVPAEWAMQVLALLSWGLWAYLVFAVLLRVTAHMEVRLRSAGTLWAASEAWAWSPVKLAVDLAIGAAVLSSTMNASSRGATLTPQSGWASTIAPHVATLRSDIKRVPSIPERHDCPGERESMSREGAMEHPRDSRRGNGTYVVRPGDSLWSIAESKLHDPYRWREIWRLNRDRDMPDGERMLRPGYIRPGWTLRLPVTERVDEPPRSDEEKRHQKAPEEQIAVQPPAESRVGGSRTPTPSPTSSNEPNLERDDDAVRRVELPSGTAVTVAFIAGFLSAVALRELRKWSKRRPQPLARGWPRAKTRLDLRGRFIRALAKVPKGSELKPEEVNPGSIQTLLRDLPAESGPTDVLLGHREGAPVPARRRGCVYSITGERATALSYLQDLALHTLVSSATDTEIWTTDALGLESLDGVKTFKDLRSLVSELEIEILKRHRMFDEEEVGDWEAHQEAWPDDPLPLVVAVFTDEAGPLRNRLLAVATQGQELGLVVIAADSTEDGIRLEGNVLSPSGSFKDELGDRFDPIAFDDTDRDEIVARLTEDELAVPDQKSSVARMQTAPDPSPGPLPVRVKLFGSPEILEVPDDVGDGFGAKSRELLFFLLLHPQGVGRDQIIEALWPETDPDKGYENFKFQLRVIRRHLRNESAPTEKFIEQTDDVYRPASAAFEVDVWEFDRLIGQAAEGGAAEALESATSLYREELLRTVYYSWAEPMQRHFADTLLDALVKLSNERLARGDDAGALRTLRKAIDANPHSEYLYRRTMEIYGQLGRANDIRRTYSELEAALAEIEAEPDHETAELRTRLLNGLRQKPTSANSN